MGCDRGRRPGKKAVSLLLASLACNGVAVAREVAVAGEQAEQVSQVFREDTALRPTLGGSPFRTPRDGRLLSTPCIRLTAALGTTQLLGIRAVATFLGAVQTDILGVRRRPAIRPQSKRHSPGRRPRAMDEQIPHVGPYVQVVPHGAADDREEVGRRRAAAAVASTKKPVRRLCRARHRRGTMRSSALCGVVIGPVGIFRGCESRKLRIIRHRPSRKSSRSSAFL